MGSFCVHRYHSIWLRRRLPGEAGGQRLALAAGPSRICCLGAASCHTRLLWPSLSASSIDLYSPLASLPIYPHARCSLARFPPDKCAPPGECHSPAPPPPTTTSCPLPASVMSSGPLSGALTTSLAHHSVRSSTPLPSPTPASLVATATTFLAASVANAFSAYVTPCPGSSAAPNVVHVVIHTTVTIPDFSRYYKVPISSFHPTYIALDDGSLISSIYTSNLAVSEGWLVMGGALGVFFLRNTYRAIQYARIVNVKNKSLFYMLAVSQAIGIVVSVTFVVADFDWTLNCTA